MNRLDIRPPEKLKAIITSLPFWSVLACILAIFVVPQASSDIILTFSKMIVAALAVVLLFSLWFLDRRLLKSSMPIAALVFLALYILSSGLSNTAFSSMPTYTLIGYKNWSTGYYFSALCVLLFIASTLRYKCDPWRFTYLPFFVLTLVLLFICVAEILGFNVLLGSTWFRFHGSPLSLSQTSFPIAGIGNSGLLAGLWLLITPLPLLLDKKHDITYYFWTLAVAIGIGSCHSKSALLIFAIYNMFLFLYFLRPRVLWRATWSLLTIAIGYASVPVFQFSNAFLYSHGVVGRQNAENFNPNSKDYGISAGSRIIIYKSTVKLILQRPVMGWGYETLQEKFFDNLSPSDYLYFISPVMQQKEDETVKRFGNVHVLVKKNNPKVGISAQNYTVVKPHNTVLEEIYSNGIIGFAFFILGIGICVNHIIKRKNRTSLVLLASCSLYGIYLMFWFTTAGVTTFAAILFGLAVRMSTIKTDDSDLTAQGSS